MKFKQGDKVVPHSKTVNGYMGLSDEVHWNDGGGKEQGFLYVQYYSDYREAYVLNSKPNIGSGSYYKESDLTPYKEDCRIYSFGDKVEPLKKSAGFSNLDECVAWKYQGGKEQGYLYVIRFNDSHNAYELSADIDEPNQADFFKESDFVPYVEPDKDYLEELIEELEEQHKEISEKLFDLVEERDRLEITLEYLREKFSHK